MKNSEKDINKIYIHKEATILEIERIENVF